MAYHIETYTVGGQILISPNLYDRVRGLVQVRGTREVHVKGIDHPVTVYDITGLEGTYRRTLPAPAPEVFAPTAGECRVPLNREAARLGQRENARGRERLCG